MKENMNDTSNAWQQSANIALTKANTAKIEGATILLQANMNAEQRAKDALARLAATELALKEAQDLVLDWQSAMEAWKDLAQTLRDEIKACPNHEAHGFGKDQNARNIRIRTVEDEARASKKLAPKYNATKTALL